MGFNYERVARLIARAVESFELELDNLTVYTEAATGGFAATAATAVAAGAESVYALAQDSTYGSATEARNHTSQLTETVGNTDCLICPDEKRQHHLRDADIITNTGFVRPINQRVIEWLGPSTAVPLMYEPWEFRETDMDIESLWASDIPVLGTDERDNRLQTQQYLRSLAPSIAFEQDLEVFRGEFIVLGQGRMARHAVAGLEALGGSVTQVHPAMGRNHDSITECDTVTEETLNQLDAVFVIDHSTDDILVGESAIVDPSELKKRTEGAIVAHICGPVEKNDMDAVGVVYAPENPAPAGTMSYTVGYLGPRPIVDLHTAGLRIGADLVREQRAGANFETATDRVSSLPFAADFEGRFKQTHGFYD